MSLFPAYKPAETENSNALPLPWLQNKSCPPEVSVVSLPESQVSQITSVSDSQRKSSEESDNSDKKETHKNNKKYKKKKSKKSSQRLPSEDYQQSRLKSKKRSRKRQPESPDRKRKKSKSHKKHHKKYYSSSSESDSESNQETSLQNNNEPLKIASHDGETKNIFLRSDMRLPSLEDAIYLDRVPDRNNSIFCNTHYSQVAKYSKLSKLPLGVGSWFDFTNKQKKKKKYRYFNKSHRFLQNSTTITKLLNEFNLEYIPLKLTYNEEKKIQKKMKDGSPSRINDLGIMDSATEDYLLGRGKTTGEEDVGLTVEAQNPERKYWQDQIKSYNERLTKEPHNISLWLEFIDVQDKAISHIFDDTNEQKTITKGKNVKLLTERKLSVLEVAIAKNIRVLDLHLKRLHIGEDLWENNKLTLEWNKLVSNFPNDINMWHQYLIFHQTYFSMFQLDRTVQAYAKCMERLLQMQQGTFLSHKPPENIGFALIDLATQLSFIWYQGGFIERSIALFQALIELNLFCPSQLEDNLGVESKIDIFEAFWDSKAPRFGEKDSIGWAKFMEKREPVAFPEEILEGAHDEEDEILLKGGSKAELWLQLESSRELSHWMPYQQDPDYCEDTERMVSFSAIRKHLFLLSSQEEIFYLILQFLTFLGVSIPEWILTSSAPSYKAPIFYPLRLATLRSIVATNEAKGENIFDFPVIGPSIHKTKTETFFTFVCDVILRSLEVVPTSQKAKLVIILTRLIEERCLVLRQNGELSSSLMKMFKKKIKNLLKQVEFRSDLSIYFQYAKFECSLGSCDEALNVHTMALGLGLQGGLNLMSDSLNCDILWRHLISLIHLELEREEVASIKSINRILSVACSVLLEGRLSGPQESHTGSQILRLKKKIHSLIESKLERLTTNPQSGVIFVHYLAAVLAVLQLLTVGFKPACLVVEEIIEKMDKIEGDRKRPGGTKELKSIPISRIKEQLYEDYLWLIKVAPKLSQTFTCLPMSPSSVRQILKGAIKVAPKNVFFLQRFGEYQNWRDILCGLDLHEAGDSDILVIIFRLLPHIKKVMHLISSAEFGLVSSGYQLENVLESAVRSEPGRCCPLLWRLYLRLIRATRPSQLKKVAYRALESCPNAKCLYLDCVTLLPETACDVIRLMAEKGIRVRMPMEELDLLLQEEEEEDQEAGEKEFEEQVIKEEQHLGEKEL